MTKQDKLRKLAELEYEVNFSSKDFCIDYLMDLHEHLSEQEIDDLIERFDL